MGGNIIFSHGTNLSKGVMILIRKNIKANIVKAYGDTDGRWCAIDVELEDNKCTIIDLYAPNNDEPGFFIKLFEGLEHNQAHDNKIIGGDYNLILDKELDSLGKKSNTHINALAMLKHIMKQESLIDIWREKNPNEKLYTWKRSKPDMLFERLDFILISRNLTNIIGEARISPAFKSDHSMPWIILNNSETKGPGIWKLNTSVLKDKEYCDQIIEIIKKEKIGSDHICDKWERIKFEVKKFSRNYCSQKKKNRENLLKIYDRKLEFYEKQLNNVHESPYTHFTEEQILKRIKELESNREQIIQYKVNGARIRAKQNWFKYGEKSSKYFFKLETKNYSKRNRFLLKKDNKMISGLNNILKLQDQFYRNLYKAPEEYDDVNDLFEKFTKDMRLNRISENDRRYYEEQINMSELKKAVSELKKQKTPGNDGIPAEFYVHFYDHIKFLLIELMREIAKNGCTGSMAQSIITLIEKPGKDLTNLSNWRPISLMNTDAKIYSKIVANRLEGTMKQLIHHDQTGFMKGRSIQENVTDLLSVIDYVNHHNIPAVIISFDFEKAFDKLSWKFLDKTLKLFNFGPIFRTMIENINVNSQFCTINCGKTSPYQPITRGIRQGNPASSLIFNLAVEILGQNIRENPKIQGIDVKGTHKKHSQYADDLWAVLIASQENITQTLYTFEKFYLISGLKINYDKTQVLRIGSTAKTNAKIYTHKPLQWSDKIKVLGITITNNRQETIDINYKDMLNKMNKTLNPWRARALSLIGKIQVVNTLVHSQAVYKVICIAMPNSHTIKNVKNLVTKFLWEGKPARIAYSKLTMNYENGGLKLVDFELKAQMLRISWVKKSFNTLHVWKTIAITLIKYPIPYIFESNLRYNEIPFNKDWIITDIITQWSKLHYHEPTTKHEILSQKLWFNSFIKRVSDGKPYCIKSLKDLGINEIQDIINVPEGGMKTYEQFKSEVIPPKDFINILALYTQIPKNWKIKINSKSPALEHPTFSGYIFDIIFKNEKISKKFYVYELNNRVEDKKAKKIWQDRLGIKLDCTEWANIRVTPFKLTKCSKMRYFQFRLLSNKLITNIQAYKWDKELKDNTCYFCNSNPETVMHLFLECEVVKKFWRALQRWVEYFFGIYFEPLDKSVIFLDLNGADAELLNRILLKATHYIYITKCNKRVLRLYDYASELYSLYCLEKDLAIEQNVYTKFQKVWKIYEQNVL